MLATIRKSARKLLFGIANSWVSLALLSLALAYTSFYVYQGITAHENGAPLELPFRLKHWYDAFGKAATLALCLGLTAATAACAWGRWRHPKRFRLFDR
jgi:hypothetical protein